jgi:prephenate dehydrogenase
VLRQGLRDCAAIASDLAAKIYGLDVLDSSIEDDDVNYTRFLLLARQPVGAHIPPSLKAKTTLVFLIDNKPGALYRALACFALRDIDLTKCESRPTSVQLLNYLAFANKGAGLKSDPDDRRFKYCFYLDVNACELDISTQAALFHLREQSDFVRVLGSYPADSQLVGPVKDAVVTNAKRPTQHLRDARTSEEQQIQSTGTSKGNGTAIQPPAATQRLRFGIVGFGKFGQYLAKTLVKHAEIAAVDTDDVSSAAAELGVSFFPSFDLKSFMARPMDVIILNVPILSFEEVLRSLSPRDLKGKLLVDVLTVKAMPKALMKELFDDQSEVDIISSHPMFGPQSSWQSQPFVFEQVRVSNFRRAHEFLQIFEKERCNMIEMEAELHDQYALEPEFLTQFTGRILAEQHLRSTPIDTTGFKHLQRLSEAAVDDSFDHFYALYKHTHLAAQSVSSLREAMSHVERQLAAKEAYLTAHTEFRQSERAAVLRELRSTICVATEPPTSSARAAPSTMDHVTTGKESGKEEKRERGADEKVNKS